MSFVAVISSFPRVVLYHAKPNLVKKVSNGTSGVLASQKAFISGKAYRDSTPKKAPYPYKEKDYGPISAWFDKTTHRFDENTKLIVVEGPIAAGKTAFAKELAEDLGMLHLPEANLDLRLINPYGYDMRQLDPQLPESMRSFDEKDFCRDPFHFNVASFQMWLFKLRFSIYVDALAHILSTGQGVVTERSPYSDHVFVDAMFKNKYISKEAKYVYYEVRRHTIDALVRPHLIIYLDMSPACVAQKIKQRGREYEVKGKALTEKYLSDIDTIYKREFLPTMETHADIVMYDWSEPGDVEAVVEDLERMDLDSYTKYDKKQSDWRPGKEQDWAEMRRLYADYKEELLSRFNVPLYDAPELNASGEDGYEFDKIWYNAPGMKYEDGYNAKMGDGNLLFKTKESKYNPY